MVEQLRIGIESDDDNGITKRLYTVLCNVIKSYGYKVLDGGSAPYTEDMTEKYNELRGVK